MAASQVWLVRHGETEWSAAGKHTGSTDLPLTERGREAARAVAPALHGHTFAAVLTSPLQRARETCDLAGLGESATVVDDLHEWRYGDYEGLTTAEIRASEPGWTVWHDGCPGGESAADVGARADRVVGRLRAIDGDVAVFAHGHFLRVLGARWCGLAPAAGAVLALDTATLCRLGWEREQPVLRLWNAPTPMSVVR
ncbi:MAG TPA: histidine phosphatase family protein [Mycobacteriales bacterium]|nr:histidine phosphatase family protein [Mycobacteriales bacterium]